VGEVIMSHPKEPGATVTREASDDAWTSSVGAHDWDTETDVMPLEYCRQLIEISKRLQQRK
jgi:hypothetical protein